ncbi:MAG: hypothetical protein R3D00_04685 [Bacteroidia bacterium]
MNVRKYVMIMGLVWGVAGNVFSQNDLTAANQLRLKTNRQSMYVLGGWAVTNIAAGAALRAGSEGNIRYFHEMNAFWNVVNLGLAAGSLIGTAKSDPAGYDQWQTFREQQKIEKTLLFNSGLDLAYMATGLYLTEKSQTTQNNPERLRGYGQSLILQGGFLLVFDLSTYLIHQSHGKKVYRKMISASPGQVGMLMRF